eukprot:g29237.t1
MGREKVKVKLWRDSAPQEVEISLKPDRWLVPRIDGYDAAAEYAIIGGLVFIPLSHPWAELKSHDKHWSSSRALIHHYWGEALDEDGRQVVVLSKTVVGMPRFQQLEPQSSTRIVVEARCFFALLDAWRVLWDHLNLGLQESDLAPYLVQGQSVASRGELKLRALSYFASGQEEELR